MEHKTLQVPKTARYYILGDLSAHTKHIWIVCHGYGHLASYFLQKFQTLAALDTVIIAPEGLHRYYLNGFNGRVGASWMTKEAREDDIRDYTAFLDAVYFEVLKELDREKLRVTVLGFSQGAATVSRWMAYGSAKADTIILWAGLFPPDMNFETDRLRLNKSLNLLVVGDEDEFINLTNIEEQEKVLKESGVTYRLVRFQGKHEIPEDVLKEIVDLLNC